MSEGKLLDLPDPILLKICNYLSLLERCSIFENLSRHLKRIAHKSYSTETQLTIDSLETLSILVPRIGGYVRSLEFPFESFRDWKKRAIEDGGIGTRDVPDGYFFHSTEGSLIPDFVEFLRSRFPSLLVLQMPGGIMAFSMFNRLIDMLPSGTGLHCDSMELTAGDQMSAFREHSEDCVYLKVTGCTSAELSKMPCMPQLRKLHFQECEEFGEPWSKNFFIDQCPNVVDLTLTKGSIKVANVRYLERLEQLELVFGFVADDLTPLVSMPMLTVLSVKSFLITAESLKLLLRAFYHISDKPSFDLHLTFDSSEITRKEVRLMQSIAERIRAGEMNNKSLSLHYTQWARIPEQLEPYMEGGHKSCLRFIVDRV